MPDDACMPTWYSRLREVVDRITRAMPSTNNDEEGAEDQGISVGDTTQRLGFSAAAGNNPLTSTPVQNKAGGARAGPPQQPPSSHGHSAAHEDGASSTAGSTENGMPPLPDEWQKDLDFMLAGSGKLRHVAARLPATQARHEERRKRQACPS